MKNNYRLYITLIITILAALIIYRSAIASVITVVLNREGSSHGVFVPFLSCYFLWIKRGVLSKIELRYDFLGIPLIFIGGLISLFNIGAYQLQFLCFILFIVGLIIIILGRRFFLEISFPVLFLITMIPLTENVYITLANYIRHIAVEGSLWIISLFHIPVYREGWLIHLPNALLEINIGCSGIRYLISYFVFGLAYAYLYKSTTVSRLIIITLTIPISLAASISRLTSIFTLTYIFGPHMAEYWPHVIISWSVFFIVMIFCIASDQFISNRN